jgi:hypothetical protein
MATIKSNLKEIQAGLRGLSGAADFRKSAGGGRPLGEIIVELIAFSILRRTLADQADPSGAEYKALNPAYLRWKVSKGYSRLKNVMTGKMISLDEMRGKPTILKSRVTMIYGKTARTKQLAEWATEGGNGRPPRAFYDLSADDERKIDIAIEAAIDRAIRALGGS